MDPAESPQDQRETVAMPPAGQPAEAVLWPRRHPWLTGLGLLALAIAILILLWDWNWLKRPIERFVEAQTGREFHIDGDLDVDLGRMTRVTADGLRFANANWAKEQQMAKTDRLAFSFELLPAIFKRDFRVPEEQSLAAFSALQRQGIPSRYVQIPDENHWVLKPRNWADWQQEMLDWVDRWTAPSP